MSAPRRNFFFKLEQVTIQMIDGLLLDLLALLPGSLPILEPRAATKMCSIVAFQAMKNDSTMDQVRRLDRGVLQETLCRRRAHGSSCAKMLARWMVRAGAPLRPRIP